MSKGTQSERIARILVALDASRRSLAALETAIDLATHLRAELQGLFVEDIQLRRLASLPIAWEIGYSSSAPRRLDTTAIERAFRMQAEEVRRLLESKATQAALSWTFRVTKESETPATLVTSREADVVIIGHGRAHARRAPSLRAHAALLSVAVVYDGTAEAQRELSIAARLAAKLARSVTVLIASPDEQRAAQLRQEALTWFRERGVPAAAYQTAVGSGEALLSALRRVEPEVLLIRGDSPLLDAATADVLLNKTDFPVALVRQPREA